MKIVIDRHIPFIEGVLEPFAEVVYADPSAIDRTMCRDADALIIRTRTRVGKELLEGSRCRFVATATIGIDHIDTDWCSANGIQVYNAAGCNAPAVAQYVVSAISLLAHKPFDQMTIGIIGVGNIGGLLAEWTKSLGMNTLLVDPLRAANEGGNTWSTLEEVTGKADIVTFHTPLTRTGPHPTYHLADRHFFESLERQPVIINTSRGEVIDNLAWSRAIDKGLVRNSVVDVWENEPAISEELFTKADITTPHIAGYSVEGKIRATLMVLDRLRNYLNLPELKPDVELPAETPRNIKGLDFLGSYNPAHDSLQMKMAFQEAPAGDKRAVFEQLRDNYRLRHEFTTYPEI